MIRVLIVGKDCWSCRQLPQLLSGQADIRVVGIAQNAAHAKQFLEQVDLVLVCAGLPEDGAYELTRKFVQDGICVPVVVFGIPDISAAILRFIEAGARGYVLEGAGRLELLRNLKAAVRGEAHVSPCHAAAIFARMAELSNCVEELRPGPPELANLTRREREILTLIGHNFTNRDIADHLFIEVGTVKNHVHSILSKLKVSSRNEAATYFPRMRTRSRLPGRYGKDMAQEQYLLK